MNGSVLSVCSVVKLFRDPHSQSSLPAVAGTPARPGAERVRPPVDDEMTVESYVMKSEVRGTGCDPRALKDAQWLVKVRMITDGRTFNVQTDQSHFDKLNEGDRVQVTYRVGKYSKTIWSAEITGKKKQKATLGSTINLLHHKAYCKPVLSE